ncbi:MAG TPA: HEAT repeat domain-containing protein [Flavisolibacter sp.]|nr:HEAT repeat domain-containing protein [Flavisolibacter sp.]
MPLLQRIIFLLLFAPAETLFGQAVVGTIDLYGADLVSRQRILSTLSLKEGDTLRVRTDSLEKQLLLIHGIKAANVEAVCCTEGKFSLFIGIDSVALSSPTGRYARGLLLPDTVQKLYAGYIEALKRAVAAGESEDDLSEGHSLMKSEMVRSIQEKFIPFANSYFNRLSAILLSSSHAEQRAIAATVIAYANDKAAVAKLYQEALQDPDPDVRNNVLRALTGLAIYGQQHPETKIVVPASIFVSLLHSVHWTDRNKALFCLMTLTGNKDEALYPALKANAVPALLQMSQWHSKSHAFMPYMILGRLLGVEDEKIFQSWQNGKFDVVWKEAAKELH